VNRCTECNKEFKQKCHLLRHQRTVHSNRIFTCENCQHTFNRIENLQRHLLTCIKPIATETINTRKRKPEKNFEESQQKYPRKEETGVCNWCGHHKVLRVGKKFCESCGKVGRECGWCHRPLPERFYGKSLDVCDSCIRRRENYIQRGGGANTKEALDGSVQTTSLEPNPGNLWDLLQFFVDNQESISDILLKKLEQTTGIKWFITVFVKFVKYNENNEPMYAEPTFRSHTSTMTNGSELEEEIASSCRKVYNDYQNFERDGSGWAIDEIVKMEVNSVEYVPLSGSSYVPLPANILKKRAVLNIHNKDQKCFIWSILAALHPIPRTQNANQVSHYVQFETDLRTDNIKMPMPLSSISHFEKMNNISVNVFGLEKKEVYPLKITESRYTRHVNLLLISNGDKRHYCLIKHLNRLLGSRTKHKAQTFFCNYCLHGYSSEVLLHKHLPDCKPHGPQKVTFPSKEEQQWIKFNSIHKQLKVPFVVYADFESITRPVYGCSPEHARTTRYQKHEPSGFCYMVKCTNDQLSKPAYVYRGPDAVDKFFEKLLEEEKEISMMLDQVVPMDLSKEEEQQFQNAKCCYICEQKLGIDPVRDHDHLTGEYRGAAHANCNLQLQFRKGKTTKSNYSRYFLPVILHNLSGYDLHLMMSSVGKLKDKKLSCIPHNLENYISLTVDNIRFIDSLKFMDASLETLVENLKDMGVSKFRQLTSHFTKEEETKLLLRKGVYPYDYMDDEARFDETELPPPSGFYNKLKDTEVSQEDYYHAYDVWKTFNIKNMGEYHDLYLKSDVLLLADVFENFRDVCFGNYKLDPAHYFSAPGLAWDAMLKKTNVNLQLLDDIDMVHMLQKGIRGGVSMISQKYAKANNHMFPDYDKTKPSSWITYLDMNNLYGTAMCESLPVKSFSWLDDHEIATFDVMSILDDSDTGYILEVDLEYPFHLHDLHNDYPLAPESKVITEEMLSSYSKELKNKLLLSGKPNAKLVPNLWNKTKYVIHYRNLKLYLQYGMKLTKIHRVIQFEQSAWLKTYIEFNTEMRKQAKNNFEKDFYKLMNNAAYGKFLENIFKRINVELVQTRKRLRKLCAKPNFQSCKIFNDDLVAVNLSKTNLVFNKPIFVGFSILDISKLLMYQFHYEYIKDKYGENASLLFTDTDSLTYSIETNDIYADMKENNHLFDTSNYNKDNPLYSCQNAKVLGKMKDETAGQPIKEYVGLKAKMYSMIYSSKKEVETGNCIFYDVEKKTAKGVSLTTIQKQLKHSVYRDSLFEEEIMRNEMSFIRSDHHELYSITMNKISLSPYDDKRHILKDRVHTLAHGHYKISEF